MTKNLHFSDSQSGISGFEVTKSIMITILIMRGIVSFLGEGSSLALVVNPSRNGVSIKIMVRRQLKPNPQLL